MGHVYRVVAEVRRIHRETDDEKLRLEKTNELIDGAGFGANPDTILELAFPKNS